MSYLLVNSGECPEDMEVFLYENGELEEAIKDMKKLQGEDYGDFCIYLYNVRYRDKNKEPCMLAMVENGVYEETKNMEKYKI